MPDNADRSESVGERRDRSRLGLFDVSTVILMLAVVIAVCWIVKLSRNQAALKKSMARTEGNLSGPQTCQAGDLVQPFKTTNLSEQPAEIRYDGTAKYLLLIFSPRCDVCREQIPEFNRLASRFRARGYIAKGISIDSLSESRQNLNPDELDFETLIMPSMSVQRTYRVVSVPQILIVSGNGQVEWIHYGALTADNISSLVTQFL
jgi:peroxiredoxin